MGLSDPASASNNNKSEGLSPETKMPSYHHPAPPVPAITEMNCNKRLRIQFKSLIPAEVECSRRARSAKPFALISLSGHSIPVLVSLLTETMEEGDIGALESVHSG